MVNSGRTPMIMRNQGFTLIEVLVVVAIIGLLSAIAWPGYQAYVESARRTAAQAQLLDLTQRLERYYSEGNTYAGYNVPDWLGQIPAEGDGERQYAIELVVAGNGQSYQLRAIPEGVQEDDECGTLTIDQVGRKGASKDDCWR